MNKGGLCCVGAAEKRNCVQEIMVQQVECIARF